jgi:hypothetical protein
VGVGRYLSAPAIAQTTQQNFAQSVGVPNPVTPMGVDPATQQSRPAVNPFGGRPFSESPDNADDASTAPEASNDMGTRQNPIGIPHEVHSGPFGTTTQDTNAD